MVIMLVGMGVELEGWRDAYDVDPSIVYALDSDYRIVRCNTAWDRFALENEGQGVVGSAQIGRCVLDVTCEELRPFYKTKFERVLSRQIGDSHVFECSSPTIFRQFHMSILPRGDEGLLIVNSLAREESHPAGADSGLADYLNDSGFIKMCAHCRRSMRGRPPLRWDWVPTALIQKQYPVRHELCSICFAYHYPHL